MDKPQSQEHVSVRYLIRCFHPIECIEAIIKMLLQHLNEIKLFVNTLLKANLKFASKVVLL